MASASSPSISRRDKEKKVSLRDLMHEIVDRKTESLKQLFVGVMGDQKTGRRTLLRRFADMIGGPFKQQQVDSGNQKRRQRSGQKKEDEERDEFLVELSERPNALGRGVVCMHSRVFDPQDLDFETMHEIVRELHSFVVIFDVGRSSTLVAAIDIMVKVTEFLRSWAPDFVLVGNKIDLAQREVSAVRGREVAENCKAER